MNSTLKEMPLLPAIFCNVVSDALLSKLENDKKRKFHIQIKNLEATIERNQIDMEQLESQTRGLFASQQQTHLIYSDDQLIKMMERTESELERAQLHIVMLEDEIASFRGEFELGTTPLKDVEWIATTTPLYIKLKNLELTRGELLTRYKAANPSVKKIDHQIEAVKKTLMPNLESGIKYIEVDNMRRELVSELISLQGQREAAIKRVSFFENELNQQQAMLSQPSPQQRLLRQNTEELNVLKRVHVDSHKALHTAKMQLLATRSGLDILERASADFYSKSTGLAKLIVLGIILGMGIGVGSCFLLNNWSNTLKNTIDIKRQFHLSIMGAIPHWNNDEKYIDEMEPDSQIAEVYSVLRNNIRFSPLRGAEKSLLVVSPSQSEGKTLTAINLALSFALEGSSCLLISADLRRPYTLTQFRQTKDTKRTKGICEYLNEEANIDDAIFKSNFNNLDLVPTCARAKNPTKLLKSERFKALVEKGKADYDIVIIDSPAILPVVDTSIISSHVNAALFVAKADKTATHDIENSLSRLEHVNCPIVGIALNGIKDLKLEAFYGYGRSQYSGYYT